MSAIRPASVCPRRLPDRPNLEQLRHQAKDILKGYLSGDPDSVAEVRRFERTPSSPFKLTDDNGFSPEPMDSKAGQS